MGSGNKTARRTDARPLTSGLEIILAAALTVGALVCLAVAEGAELTLAWVDNSGGTAGVKIERRLATDGTFVEVAVQAPGVVSYTDATVVSGATYCYRVKAYNELGESAYSSQTCGTSAAPGSVLTFAWTGVPGATQYGVEFTGTDRRFANPNGTAPDGVNGFSGAGGGFLVAGTTLTLTLPTGIPAGTYQVRVIGVLGQGLVGTFSDAVTIVVGTGTTTALQ